MGRKKGGTLQTSILTNRDLLLPVIQSRTIIAKNELSDSDIQKLVAALRALTSTIVRAGTKEAVLLLPEDLTAARGACCVALEALGNKTQGFDIRDVPDFVCPLPLRGPNDDYQNDAGCLSFVWKGCKKVSLFFMHRFRG